MTGYLNHIIFYFCKERPQWLEEDWTIRITLEQSYLAPI